MFNFNKNLKQSLRLLAQNADKLEFQPVHRRTCCMTSLLSGYIKDNDILIEGSAIDFGCKILRRFSSSELNMDIKSIRIKLNTANRRGNARGWFCFTRGRKITQNLAVCLFVKRNIMAALLECDLQKGSPAFTA